jgi:hypothetical protein
VSNWRSIPARDVDWRRFARSINKTQAAGTVILRLCRDGTGYEKGDWSDLTLGDIANLGVRQWMRKSGVGETTVALVKHVIDRAAEGENVTTQAPAPDAYIPQCEREAGEP